MMHVVRSRPWLLALAGWLLLPALAGAAEPFPRGPGFYFSPFKVVMVAGVYLVWLSICNWVNKDAQALDLAADRWNSLLLAAGVFGLLVVWLLPTFFLSWMVLVTAIAAAGYFYVHVRNQRVPVAERVLTEAHLRQVIARLFRLKKRGKAKADAEPETRTGHGKVPIRFMGRSAGQKQDDAGRVARLQESKGYKGALDMVYEACQRRATDIHLEPGKDEMSVRFRIDGMMVQSEPFSRAMGDAVVNIFKVLSNLDITEKRKPQDGSFSAQVEDHIVDFRVATAGSVVGEKMVMRILDKSAALIDLTLLGMRDKMREQVHDLATQPHGLFVVCGPTGAGKSTTLYACLNELDRQQQNIITIENPVEYQLENVTQIEVNLKAGKTFASELRSILRQDPNVIMIGEVRDQETAEIACQAAQTGHMVFTTLHANDTITAIGRLIDLGVKPFLIGTALSAVLSQRLIRLLCPACKVKYKPNPDLLRKANLPADKIKFFYRPPDADKDAESDEDGPAPPIEVCKTCGGTGYFKRTGIFEFLVVNDKIRDLIRDNPNLGAIKQEAVKSGMRYLYEDGIRQVIEGKTSIQELLRVSK